MLISPLLLFFGSFWEASMDAIGTPHNYEASIWKRLANYFDKKGIHSLGNNFWDNRIAWRNKWKNGDPAQGEKFLGSSTAFVMLMDGWHVVKAIWLVHLFAALVCYQPITQYAVIDFVLLMLVFCIGHEFFFRLVQFKLLH